jgi:hypothetical protein
MGDFFGLLMQTILLTIPTALVLGSLFFLFYNFETVWERIKRWGSKDKSKKEVLVPDQKKLMEAALEANEEIRLPMEQVLYIIRNWNDYNFFSTEDGKIAVKKIKEVMESQKADLILEDGEVKSIAETKSVNFKAEDEKDESEEKKQDEKTEVKPEKPFNPETMSEEELRKIHQKAFYIDKHFYSVALDDEYIMIVDGYTWKKTEIATNRIIEQGIFAEEEELKRIRQEHHEKTNKKHNNRKSAKAALSENEFAPTEEEEKIAKEMATKSFPKIDVEKESQEQDRMIAEYEAILEEQRKKEDEEKRKMPPPPKEEGEAQMLDAKEISKSLNEKNEDKQQETKTQPQQQNQTIKKEKKPFWLSHDFVDARSLVEYFCAHDNSFQTNIEDFFMWLGENFQHVYLEEKKHLYIAPSSLLCGIASTINPEHREQFLDYFFAEHQLHVPRLEDFLSRLRSQMELRYSFSIFDKYKKNEDGEFASIFKVGLLSRRKKFKGPFLKIRISQKTFPNFLKDEVVGRFALCELLTTNSMELESLNGKEVKMLGRKEAEKWIIA